VRSGSPRLCEKTFDDARNKLAAGSGNRSRKLPIMATLSRGVERGEALQ